LLPPPTAVTILHRAAVAGLIGLLLWRGRAVVWPRTDPGDGGDRSLEAEIGLGVALMLLVFPIAWIHYFQFLVVPVTLLPFWWRKEGLTPRSTTVAILVVGVLLAAGGAVREGAHYSRFEGEIWFRVLQCYRTVGAVLLAWGFARALGDVSRTRDSGTG
jgi:hypothetical protein